MAKQDKQALIDHLKLIAHMFSKDKDVFRSRAFSKAADELQARLGPVEMKKGKLAEEIPGVGKAIKDVIEQFFATGTSEKLEKLKAKLPNEVLERFDSKTCKRMVNKLLKPLTDKGIDWGFAGSIRRGLPTCKDIDVVVCVKSEATKEYVKQVLAKAGLKADVRNGEQKIGVSLPLKTQGRAVTLDLNFTVPEERGAMYLYFTGPKSFNIEQRRRAKALGLTLSQHGLYKGKKCVISGQTEKEMFEALGEEYIVPEARA